VNLLIKRIVYLEDAEPAEDGKKVGKVKMDLWELPPISPSYLSSTNSFAERNAWLPEDEEITNWITPLKLGTY